MIRISLCKKGLVVAVILLFISVSVIPATATVVEKKSTLLDDNESYFEDVDVLIIGRCHTRIHDGEWSRFLYIGNSASPGLGIGNTSLQRIHIIVYNKTISNQYDSFIRFTNGVVCMRNASGIFFWGASKSGVRFISPIVFIRCHTDKLWIRDNNYSP